jgi:hypothetical protein
MSGAERNMHLGAWQFRAGTNGPYSCFSNTKIGIHNNNKFVE